MRATVRIDQLAGVAEVCALAGVTRRGLKKWRDETDFPQPVRELAATPLWDMRAVTRWLEQRRRPRTS